MFNSMAQMPKWDILMGSILDLSFCEMIAPQGIQLTTKTPSFIKCLWIFCIFSFTLMLQWWLVRLEEMPATDRWPT